MRRWITLIALLLLCTQGYTYNYNAEFQRLESLTEQRMHHGALTLTNEIYNRAKREGRTDMQLQALRQSALTQLALDYSARYELADSLRAMESEFQHDRVSLALLNNIESQLLRNQILRNKETAERYDSIVARCMESKEALSAVAPEPYAKIVAFDNDEVASTTLYIELLRSYAEIYQRYWLNAKVLKGIYEELLSLPQMNDELQISTQLAYANFMHEDTPETLRDLAQRYKYSDGVVLVWSRIIRDEIYTEQSKSDENLNFERIESICKDIKSRYPDSKHLKAIDDIISSLHSQGGSINIPRQLYPNSETQIDISTRNVKRLDIETYQLPKATIDDTDNIERYNAKGKAKIDSLAHTGVLVDNQHITLKPRLNQNMKHSVPIRVKSCGYYLVVVRDEAGNILTGDITYVSRIGAIISLSDNKFTAYLADFRSGEPIKKATFDIYTEEGKSYQFSRKLESTDGRYTVADGRLLYTNTQYTISIDDSAGDTFTTRNTLYNRAKSQSTQNNKYTITSYTDRAAYRPGDTVHIHSIVYAPSQRVISGLHICNRLDLPSGKTLDYKYETSDSWGGARSSFKIPEYAQAGQYRVYAWSNSGKANNGYRYIRVENYTQPTSEIEMTPQREAYEPKDTVRLTCRVTGYDGRSMEGVEIDYTIEQGAKYGRGDYETTEHKCVKTDNKGEYVIEFIAEAKSQLYNVTARMVDKNGESREVVLYIETKERPYWLSLNAPWLIARSCNLPFTFDLHPQSTESQTWSYSIHNADNDKLVYSGEFKPNEPLKIDYKRLKDGLYQIEWSTTDGRGTGSNRQFRLYTDSASKNAIDDNTLTADLPQKSIAQGNDIRYIVSTNQLELRALVTLSRGDSILYSEVKQLTQGTHECSISYNDDFTQQLNLRIEAIKDSQLHKQTFNIEYYAPKEDIEVEIEKLADEFKASEGGELRVRVTDKATKEGVAANLIVTIYDKASDQINENRLPPLATKQRIQGYVSRAAGAFNINNYWFSFVQDNDNVQIRGLGFAESNDDMTYLSVGYSSAQRKESTGALHIEQNKNIRDDFSQTVLFRGDITTDDNGVAVIPFTLSDLLTTYNVKVVAVTKDARSAMAEDEFVATKRVMVSTLVPQFVRVCDMVKLKTLATNRYDYPIVATIKMKIADNDTRTLFNNGVRQVSLQPHSSQSIEWAITAPDASKELKLTISLESANDSDTEQHIIAVDPAVERINIGDLKYIGNSKLNLIYTPSTLLVDGAFNEEMDASYMSIMPTMIGMIERENDSEPTTAIDFANKFYVSAATYNVAIRYKESVLEAFKNKAHANNSKSEAWFSHLAEMRNSATASSNKSLYRIRLKEFVCSDGGYSWLRGGESSLSVSLYVTRRLLSEIALRAKSVEVENLTDEVQNSLKYLDREIAKDSTTISATMLDYLELRSRTIVDGNTPTATWNSYIDLIEQEWRTLNTYHMAQVALVLQRSGRDANQIIEVVKQHAVSYPDGGTTFPSGCANNFSTIVEGNIAAHTLIMTLLRKTGEDDDLVREMFKWLILQRKHQLWVNSATTLEVLSTMIELYNSGIFREQNTAYISYPAGMVKSRTFVTNSLDMDVVKSGKPISIRSSSSSTKSKTPVIFELNYSYDVALKDIQPNNSGFEVTRDIVGAGAEVKVGDIVKVRYTIKSQNNINMVKLHTMKCGAYEPRDVASGYRNGYYRDIKRDGIDYYIDLVPRGTTTIEEEFMAWYGGTFSDGYVVVESITNPHLSGNSGIEQIVVE